MNRLWWQTLSGKKNCHLVLLHGWGLNSEVWNCVSSKLTSHFTLHLVDLPGFGRSQGFSVMCIEEMASHVLRNAPDKAIWLGWSLGGLVASQVALMNPRRVHALVTVASSPCFRAQKGWFGINSEILVSFQQQLSENFQRTVERFLALQMLRTNATRKNMKILQNAVSSLPIPNIDILNGGLEILKSVDLRKPLANLVLPHLRIYGYLDSLVPFKIAKILDAYWPNSESLIIKKAAHAPFISHPKEFCNAVIALSYQLC